MPPSSAANPFFGSDPLLALCQEVISARAAMVVARRAPLGTASLVEGTRTRLLRALEAYAAGLEARHLPRPSGIRAVRRRPVHETRAPSRTPSRLMAPINSLPMRPSMSFCTGASARRQSACSLTLSV